MKLHRDIGVSQPTAWFVLHRIREAWGGRDGEPKFAGPVEVDETYMGGKRKNMSNAKRATLEGRGAVGKTAVVGAKDRATKQVAARVVESTDKPTLQGFVGEHAAPGATVYTGEAAAYEGIPYHHETVKHSVAEYVRGMAHTNGMESFWSMLKRAHTGTFHKENRRPEGVMTGGFSPTPFLPSRFSCKESHYGPATRRTALPPAGARTRFLPSPSKAESGRIARLDQRIATSPENPG